MAVHEISSSRILANLFCFFRFYKTMRRQKLNSASILHSCTDDHLLSCFSMISFNLNIFLKIR